MKNKFLLNTIILFFVSVSCFAQTVFRNYRDGQVYLKFKDESTFTFPDYNASHPVPYPESFSTLINQFEIYSIQKAFPLLKTKRLEHTYRVSFRNLSRVDELIDALEKIALVEYAEKIPLRRVSLTPNDPSIASQYALTKINAFNAWNLSTGSHTVKVAIVDDEVRLDHADLTANRWINPGEIAGNGLDDDGDGYADDVSGYDVADNDGDPSPPPTVTNSFQTHGTHCAGIADAVSNNGTGIASIGYGLSLMGVKCNPDTITDPEVIYYAIEGVQYAISAHADVVSMSWGGAEYSYSEQDVFDAGWNEGIIFVAAAGNNSTGDIYFPAGYNHIVSVGSTSSTDAKSGFSNFGAWVSVFAPGSSIYSTLAGSNTSYGNLSGTSMSTPMVAGLCGLMKSYNPALTPAQIVSCLVSTCDNIDAVNSGYVGQLGGGRVNALAALQCVDPAASPVAQFSTINSTSCDGRVSFTDESTFHPDQWLWYFGDGDSSDVQNPTHQYLSSNNYTVTLKVTNGNGSNTTTQTNLISVSLPAAPFTVDTAVCSSGTVALTATGTDTLKWYDAPVDGNLLASGNVFHSPVLTVTTTYYVQNEVTTPLQFTGAPDSTIGGGSVFTGANYHDILFDCYAPCTLISVKVYAQGAGDRTITLIQNESIIQTVTVNIPDGISRVTLNFDIPVGNDLELGCADVTGFYRNNSGVSFPYTIPGVLSLTGTNAGTAFYYYFYDWEIQGPPCISPRTPVVATVLPAPVAGYNQAVVANLGSFSDASSGAVVSRWDFGDPASGANDSSNLLNPDHLFSAIGSYNVCLTVAGVNGCTDRYCDSVHVTTLVGIQQMNKDESIVVYPNPVNDVLSIDFSPVLSGKKWSLRLTDAVGKVVAEKTISNVTPSGKYNWDLSSIVPGVYLLQLQDDDHSVIRKIIRE